MSVKFFGQFLIEQGEVDADQVREAIELMEDENPTLGEIAIDRGFMSWPQAIRVSAEQRHHDRLFGDLAVSMGFLTNEQLVEIVQVQCERRLPIGQALARLGHIEGDRLGLLLDAFKADQSMYDTLDRDLPGGLAGHAAAGHALELLPRLLMRIARMPARVGDLARFDAPPAFADVSVSVLLRGARGLEIALLADMEFAGAVAKATSGLGPEELDAEMAADGVGEFLNVLGGNAISAVAADGQRFELEPPDYEASLEDGWIVDLAVGTGRAALVLSVIQRPG